MRCSVTSSKSHSEAQRLCCGKTRGRNVKQVVEATAVTKTIQAKDSTEEATEQKIQVCYHVKQGKQGSQTWSVAQSTLNAGILSGRCLDGEFLPPTQEPFLGPSTGTGVLLLTRVRHAAALWEPLATLPTFYRATFMLFPFLSSCNRQDVSVPQFIQKHHVFLFSETDQWHFLPLNQKNLSLPPTSKTSLLIPKTLSRFFLMPRNSHDKGNRKKPSPPISCVCEYLQLHHCLCWVLFLFVSWLPLYSLTTFSSCQALCELSQGLMGYSVSNTI